MIEEVLRYQYIEEEKSLSQIARKFNCSTTNVMYWMKKFGILTRSISEACRIARSNHVDLTPMTLEFLNGLLLGDGHLDNHKWSAAYYHSSKHKDYLKWLSKKLVHFGIFQSGKIIRQERDSRFPENKIYHIVAFHYASHCFVELKTLQSKWYLKNGDKLRKIVPKDLVLTPETCLSWYIGDGSLTWDGGIILSTMGFEVSDIRFLIESLKSLGFKSSVRACCTTRIWTRSAKNFLNYIGPCPEDIESIYGYKWQCV